MIDSPIFKKKFCRVCGSKDLLSIINLGSTPLANAFLGKEEIDKEEKYYPLEVYFCNKCTFIQLGHVVSPKILFSDYVYLSSTSDVFIRHFVDFAEIAYKRFKLNSDSLIVDIGSNDGILLKPFKKKNIKTLGIEPAKKIAELARKDGIETLPVFLNENVAKNINKKYGKASIVTATNVFAHIDDLNEVIKAVKIILKEDGVFVIEVPYLIDFIKKRYFDLIYHEHLSYWRVQTFVKFFSKFNMEVFDVEKVPVHGGSIRVYVKKKGNKLDVNNKIKKFVKKEKLYGLDKISTYLEYSKKIQENKIKLINLLYKVKKSGDSIAGYGAPAKGNTLLNYFNIGTEILNYIIDDNSWKQGLYTPGKKIPVKDFSFLKKSKPDYLLILAWNFSDSIISKNQNFSKKGGKFIIPVPNPKIY